MPVLSSFFLFACLSSLALPLLNGFVGEFLILIGVFEHHAAWASWASTGAVLSAIYLLWAYQRVIFGDVTVEKNKSLPDASALASELSSPMLSLIILFMGVASPLFTRRMQMSSDNLLRQMSRSRAYDARTAATPSPAPWQRESSRLKAKTRRHPCVPSRNLRRLQQALPFRIRRKGRNNRMPAALQISAEQIANLYRVAPEAILCFTGILIMLVEPFLARRQQAGIRVARAGGRRRRAGVAAARGAIIPATRTAA